MFKILGSLAALFLGSGSMMGKGIDLKGIQKSILDDISLRLRKPVTLVLLGFCSAIFFCFGSFMAILNATYQYDTTGHIYATATLWTGIIIAALTAGGYTYVFTHEWPGVKQANAHKKAEEAAHEKARHEEQLHPSSIEGALAALVMDFVDTRRAHRERRDAEREARHADRNARRAEREARRSARFHQQETWKNQQSSSSAEEPQRH